MVILTQPYGLFFCCCHFIAKTKLYVKYSETVSTDTSLSFTLLRFHWGLL